MLNKVFSIAITLLLLIGLSFGLTHYYQLNLFDYSFFVGVMVTVSIFFFTSTGEVKGRFLDRGFQRLNGIRPVIERSGAWFFTTPSFLHLTGIYHYYLCCHAFILKRSIETRQVLNPLYIVRRNSF